MLNQAISFAAEGIDLLYGISTTESIARAKNNQAMCLEQVDDLRKILEEQGVKDRFSEQLAKVYEICENLLIVADKPETPEEQK